MLRPASPTRVQLRSFMLIGSTLALPNGGHFTHTGKEATMFLIPSNLLPLSLKKRKSQREREGWMDKWKKREKERGRGRERITVCTRSSFSSKNTHSLQIFGYQVLWLGGRPKCTEREYSSRRQHRKTRPVPKHRRPEQSDACMGRSESHPRCS